jgi:hypothetical protein
MATRKPFKHQPLSLDKIQIRLFRLLLAVPGGNWAGIIAIHDFEHYAEYRLSLPHEGFLAQLERSHRPEYLGLIRQ